MFHRTPLVSVVLASYGHESYVLEAVKSVLDQGIDDLELIVVDDGSSDSTPDIVESVPDSRVRLVRLKENRRYHPRNVALAMASGRYVAFQNSDDVWKPGKLAAQLAHMEADPGCSVCFTGVDIIGKDGERLEGSWANGLFSTQNRSSTAWLRKFFDSGNCLCLTSAMTRRRQVDKVGRFSAGLFNLGDFDLWTRLAAVGRFHIIDRPLTCFRVVGDSNLSSPTGPASRRSIIEYADVLARYTERPVLPLIGEVFADVMPESARSNNSRLAGLAVHAWSLGPSQRLFADRVMKAILEDPAAREEVIAVSGERIVRDFIEKRGALEIGVAE